MNRHLWVLRFNMTCWLDSGDDVGEGAQLTVAHGIESFTSHSIPLSHVLAPNIPLDTCLHPTRPTHIFLELTLEQLGMSPRNEPHSLHFRAQLPPLQLTVDLGSPLPPTLPALGWPLTAGFDAITPAMPLPRSKRTTVYQAGLECFKAKVRGSHGAGPQLLGLLLGHYC